MWYSIFGYRLCEDVPRLNSSVFTWAPRLQLYQVTLFIYDLHHCIRFPSPGKTVHILLNNVCQRKLAYRVESYMNWILILWVLGIGTEDSKLTQCIEKTAEMNVSACKIHNQFCTSESQWWDTVKRSYITYRYGDFNYETTATCLYNARDQMNRIAHPLSKIVSRFFDCHALVNISPC